MSNVLNLVISNIIALMISVLSAFITPLVLGHEQYGYYKIFSLYTTYVPLLHIGFIDGVLAINAGKRLESLSLKKFRVYTRFFFLFELILSVLMMLFLFFINTSWYNKEILLSLSIYSFVFNMVTYFQFFSKAIMNFDQFAALTRLQSYINLFYLVLAFVIYKFSSLKITFSYYLFFMNFTLLIILIAYIYIYRCIIFGESATFKEERVNIITFFKTGFIIMFSYQVTMFMINADNQFISMFFKVRDYSEYAFAYSMASLLITVFQAASSVMLPYMKRIGQDEVIKKHSENLSIICMIIFFILLSYYPILIVAYKFMPSYIESVKYLNIIFPGVGITCIIQSYLFNNYILQKRIKDFCLISIFNLIFDFIIYYLFYILFDNTFVIAMVSIPLLLIWYMTLEWYMHKKSNTSFASNFIYIVLLTISFLIFNHAYNNILLSMLSYLSYYIILSYLFFREQISIILRGIISK